MKLSLTTVMLPRWTLDEIFDRLAEAGFQAVELRVRRNPEDKAAEPSFWGRHVNDINPENLLDQAPRIREAVKRTGLPVVALTPKMAPSDLEQVDRVFRGAAALNLEAPPLVRVDPPFFDRSKPYLPQFDEARRQLRALTERAAAFRIKLLYEIHVGTLAVSAARALELLRDLDPARIGAIYDIPNMTRVGIEDPAYGIPLLGDYLAHCHIGGSRPVVLNQEGQAQKWGWEFCDLRQAAVDIPDILKQFKKAGYKGCLSLEDFAPGADEVKVREQGAYLKELLKAQG